MGSILVILRFPGAGFFSSVTAHSRVQLTTNTFKHILASLFWPTIRPDWGRSATNEGSSARDSPLRRKIITQKFEEIKERQTEILLKSDIIHFSFSIFIFLLINLLK